MPPSLFRLYKVQFARPSAPLRPGRTERDHNNDALRRFVSANGLVGELHAISPSAAFGIVEVQCTPLLAGRLLDMPEVETVREG